MSPAKKSPRVKKKKAAVSDSQGASGPDGQGDYDDMDDLDLSDDGNDDDLDDDDDDADDGRVPPWEEENGVYGIMVGCMESMA